MKRNHIIVGLVGACGSAWANPVWAQDDLGELSASTRVETTAPANRAAAAQTDHERFVGTFGVGYMGFSTIQLPANADGSSVNGVSAPVIGVRYWLSSLLGLDLGLGFNFGGATVTVNDMENDEAFPGVYILHAGVPLALVSSEHFVFQVVPETNLGFSAVTYEPLDADASAFHFDLGARVGAEIHFGFIGIPQLALQAGVGLRFAVDTWGVEAAGNEVTRSQVSFGTTLNQDPWAIFAGNISALYYFGG